MSWRSKVVWSEGMFLRPQHFQQFDRYMQSVVDSRVVAARSAAWGFTELELDQQALALGKISISKAVGVFPDGTAFNIPTDDPAPAALEVPENVKNSEIYLSVPLMTPTRDEVSWSGEEEVSLARFAPRQETIRDSAAVEQSEEIEIQTGGLRTSLLIEGDERSDFTCVGVAEVVERRADSSVILDQRYIPTSVNCLDSPILQGFAVEVQGLVRHRAQALAARLGQSGQQGVAEVSDFLLLQLVNRFAPLLAHLSQQKGVHPETLYQTLLALAGEIATFTQPDKLSQEFPPYQHEALRESFEPVMQSLRSALSMVLEQNAISIPLVDRKFGVRVGKITDRSLLRDANFILAVKASVKTETLRANLPKQIKIGSVEVIKDLVNKQIPGIGISALPVAPRQIPYHVGYSYFELDRNNQYWEMLNKTGAVALHIAGEYPDLDLELWAIRG